MRISPHRIAHHLVFIEAANGSLRNDSCVTAREDFYMALLDPRPDLTRQSFETQQARSKLFSKLQTEEPDAFNVRMICSEGYPGCR